MNKATVLRADGTKEVLDHQPTLKEAQKIIGGWIEYVRTHEGNILVVDEDGKLKDKPVNLTASLGTFPIFIVGDVIYLEGWNGVAGD